jgi:exonuclease VII small subunit
LFLDPDKLQDHTPAEILDALSRGHLGPDHRLLKALLDRREETLNAAIAFSERDRAADRFDIASELIAIFRYFKAPEGIPFYLRYIKEDPENVPDEVVVGLVEQGALALEPALKLYSELDEGESGEVAFILANLHVRDERILNLLLDRIEYDLSDTALLLGIYGDPAAKAPLEAAAALLEPKDAELKKEIQHVVATLESDQAPLEDEPFDIWDLYPEHEDLPVDALDEDERIELLRHSSAEVRSAAAHSFFNQQLEEPIRKALLNVAQTDDDPKVRASAWESLIDATEHSEIVEAMLQALRRPGVTVEERGGLVVGLAPETDRNEVRKAILDLYGIPEGRAKALEAMWRSVHPSFRDYFAKHLNDTDLEVRRGALWGVGYYGLKSELEKVRRLFEDEDLRSDALFAYTLALPADISRGRMKGLLSRIEKDAKGLTEMEEELVKAALDERLLLAGKEPFFRQQED